MLQRDPVNRLLLLCSPAIVLLVVLVVVPAQALLLLSFIKSESFELVYDFSFANYREMISSWAYMKFMLRSIVMAAIVTCCSVAIAFPAAYWIAKFGGKHRTLYLLLAALPFFAGLILRLVALQYLLGPGALIDSLIGTIGLESLTGVMFSDFGTFLGLVYLWLPFALLALYLSFNTYPFDLERVAAVNGAGLWALLRKVIWPLNAGGIIIAAGVVFLPTIGASTEAVFLGGPNGSLAGEVIRRQIITGTWPRGATLLVVLLSVSGMSIGLMWKLFKSHGGGIEQFSRLSLRTSGITTQAGSYFGKWMLGAIYIFLYTPLAVLGWVSLSRDIHVLIPVELTTDWYFALFSTDRFFVAFLNSLAIGLGAAAIALSSGTPAAFAFVRYRARAKSMLMFLFLSPLVLTPLALGISAKLVMARIMGIPGGIWPAVLGNATYAFSFSFLLLVLAFAQYDRTFERAARVCGANGWHTFRLVTLPALFPSLLGAFLVTALIAFNNFHITFFTVGATKTLPTLLGGMLRHGLDEEVYALTVLSVGVVFVLTIVGFKLLDLKNWMERPR